MTKPMKYKDLVRRLQDADFVLLPNRGKGDHEVWQAPNGTQAILVRDTECSPGVTREALNAIQTSKGDN